MMNCKRFKNEIIALNVLWRRNGRAPAAALLVDGTRNGTRQAALRWGHDAKRLRRRVEVGKREFRNDKKKSI